MRILYYSVELQPYHLAGLAALSAMRDYEVEAAEIGLRTHDNDSAIFREYDVHVHHETESWRWACEGIRNKKYDVVFVHGFSERECRQIACAARRSRIKSVMMVDNSVRGGNRTVWKEWIKRRLVPRMCDYFFVPGENNAIYVQSLGVERCRVWKGLYSVDVAYYSKVAEAARLRSDSVRRELDLPPNYFLYVGRFVPFKNLTRLVQAYTAYRQQVVDPWDLVLVGAGSLRDSIAATGVPGLLLRDYVQFTDIGKYFALSSCFCMPSMYDHWPLVVLEAVACSTPVLASWHCGNVPELVIDGWNGWVFDPYDIQQLSDRLAQIHTLGPTLSAIGRRGRSLAEAYSAAAWAEKVDYYIRQIK